MGRHPCVLIVVVGLALVACTGGDAGTQPSGTPSRIERGGTLRVATLVDRPAIYDPQRAYASEPWEVLRCCLARTLFSYNGRPTDEGGAIARPDLAASMPEVSADGLTWTIRLRQGLRYAPPLADVEITAADIVRALRRLADPDITNMRGFWTSGYPWYYSVIEGFDEYREGDAEAISGLGTPNDHTLVVHLTRPSGDLPYLLAEPATAPIPANPHDPTAVLGVAEGHRDYGPFQISSGPYMIEGSEDLDLSLPAELRTLPSGYTPSTFEELTVNSATIRTPGSLVLVRNPSWTPETDPLRGAFVDRIEIVPIKVPEQASSLVASGGADVLLYEPRAIQPSLDVSEYRADPDLADRLLMAEWNATGFLWMNLATPPFDDVHVRRAAALVLDREALSRMHPFGGEVSTAWHVAPDSLGDDLLSSWRPSWLSDSSGDVHAAMDEMRLSRYDADGDGRCDASVCSDVPAGGAALRPSTTDFGDSAAIAEDLRRIGIHLDVTMHRSIPSYYGTLYSGGMAIEATVLSGWIADFPNGATFFTPLFASWSPYNGGMVGADFDRLRELGLPAADVPSVDDRIERCLALTGSDQIDCWNSLDQYLMEEVVPVVPLHVSLIATPVSDRVVRGSICQFTGMPALDRIALAPD